MKKTSVIRIDVELKKQLDALKEHPRETYEDVIRRLVEKWKTKRRSQYATYSTAR